MKINRQRRFCAASCVPDWDEDSPALAENLTAALRLCRDAAIARNAPSRELPRAWQIRTLEALDVPDPAYVGAFRGEKGLETCNVRIGFAFGTDAGLVLEELSAFEQTLTKAVAALDALIPAGQLPANEDQLNAVIELCAWTHAEWVRIHPFANGNGRTARLWTAFIAMRYGIPPFVTLRPRPGDPYAAACAAAMTGDWMPTASTFRQMYLDAVAV